MESKDFTVIVPTRCGADLLPLPLAHLEVQTFPAARFELIVVDYGDGSQPGDLLERYSAGAPVRTRCFALPNATEARARNLAVEKAQGDYILFLDEDLLAGPTLVEGHARGQEVREGVVRGPVRIHPQVDPRTLTKRFRSSPCTANKASALAESGFHNLSMPKSVFLEAGGFDESLGFDGLQDLALAWRLHQLGTGCAQADEAAAYSWRAVRPADERRRQYYNGYSLYGLFKGEVPEEIRSDFPVECSTAQRCFQRLLQPVYRHLCESLAEGSAPFEHMFERVLCHDFRQGYRDARAGRPPRFDARAAHLAAGVRAGIRE